MTKEKDGVLCISAKSGHQQDLYSIIEKKIKLKENQEWDVVFDIQEENNDTFFVTAVCVLLLGSIIVFSGYLLIYNVMYISITKDIRFYGMLKTGNKAFCYWNTIMDYTWYYYFICSSSICNNNVCKWKQRCNAI